MLGRVEDGFSLVKGGLGWLSKGMLAHAAILVLSILWVLLCMRFYTAISRENVFQRRLIAVGAGLGAGLIYLLGSMILTLLQAPSAEPESRVPVDASDVRIRPE